MTPSMPNPLAATTTASAPVRSWRSRTRAWYGPGSALPRLRGSGGHRDIPRLGGGSAFRRIHRHRTFLPGRSQADCREGNADLPERLDRHEEPGEQEHDREELPDLEVVRDAEPIQRVAAAREQAADRDQDRRRNTAVEATGEER